METKSSFLHLFEKLEGFVGKLPGSLQKPILQEIVPLKDLFLRQRAPRIVLTGDPAASSAGLFNAIFTAPVAPFAQASAADAMPGAAGWQDFSHLGRGVLRLLDTRVTTADVPLAETTQAALATESPDAFLFLRAFGANSTGQEDALLQSELDRLEAFLDFTESRHQARPAVLGVVVNPDETEMSAAEMESARARLHVELKSRSKIPKSLDQTLALSTFIRFRLDGTFDPESDRRRNVNQLVQQLVAELPNEARLEMARLSGAREAQAKIAQTLVKSTAAVSAALGAQPIPLADLPFLLTFQVAMVSGIIYISGRELSLKLATEFLGTMGINVGLGLVLREGARAAIRAAGKLVLPGVGNIISGFVASSGTYAIGRAATAYYIEGVSLPDARRLLKEAQKGAGFFQLLGRSKALKDKGSR